MKKQTKKPKMAKCPECGMMHPGGKHPSGMKGMKGKR